MTQACKRDQATHVYSEVNSEENTVPIPTQSVYTADLYDVMYSVVIGVSNVDSDGLEGEAIPLATSLDGERAGNHGTPRTAHRTGLRSHSTAGGTVMET